MSDPLLDELLQRVLALLCCFVFFKQKTAYEILRSDWSSDVCSSDLVVFAVPEGEAEGMLVIHRVLGVDDDGFFVTQGDNRDTPDQWKLTDDDIVGEPLLHIPKGAVAIRFLQQWWVLTILLSLLAVFLLWPSSDDDDEDEDDEQMAYDLDGDDERRLLAENSAVAAAAGPAGVAVRSRFSRREPLPADVADDESTADPDRTAPIPVLAEAELLGLPDSMDIGNSRRSMPAADPDEHRIAELDRSLALLGLDVESWTAGDEAAAVDSRAMAEAEAWVDEQLAGVR